jgi:hypothetical protein
MLWGHRGLKDAHLSCTSLFLCLIFTVTKLSTSQRYYSCAFLPSDLYRYHSQKTSLDFVQEGLAGFI